MHIDREKVTIRTAVTDDADVLARIGELTFRKSYADIIPPDDLASYTASAFSPDLIRSEIRDPGTIYLLAALDIDICGYAKFQPTTPPPQITAARPVELMRLYVMPGCTGNRIGSKLIGTGLRAAAAAGYHYCWLRVWQGNKSAIKFYHGWRFDEVGSEPYQVGNAAETVLLMVRTLEDLKK